MGVITWDQAVDIGGGRGRLAPDPAASLRRVDADMRSAFGRAADINEAWRSPEQADKNYAAYLAYLNGGPWAPIALPGDRSVHCFGYAVDTDDTSDAQMRIWNEHGWYWTVYRDGKLVERWHLEYFPERDKRRFDGSPAGTADSEETELMGVLDDIRDMFNATNQAIVERTQAQHDVTRTFLRDQTQRQHDVTRAFLRDIGQAQHDVTRGYLVDTITAAVSQVSPEINEEKLRAAVEGALLGAQVEAAVDIDAIAKRVNDEADQRQRDRLRGEA